MQKYTASNYVNTASMSGCTHSSSGVRTLTIAIGPAIVTEGFYKLAQELHVNSATLGSEYYNTGAI